jgi:hypothetical protein
MAIFLNELFFHFFAGYILWNSVHFYIYFFSQCTFLKKKERKKHKIFGQYVKRMGPVVDSVKHPSNYKGKLNGIAIYNTYNVMPPHMLVSTSPTIN